MNFKRLLLLLLLLNALEFSVRFISAEEQAQVTRVTLSNGLRVVLIHNSLAPVVTVEMNFLVGGDETPPGFPGMAHAQEHMAFRGCEGMSADQTAAIYALLGGREQRRYTAEHYAVFCDRSGGRSRRRAAGAGRLPARH